jgi:hypothetical protein
MKTPSLRSQGGQMITEAILLLVALMAVTFAVANYFKNEEVLRQIITGPWQNIAGMLQNGVWAPPAVGALAHPNGHGRHIVITGEEAR